MRILLTNDDGVTSEGFIALRNALQPEHEVAIVALGLLGYQPDLLISGINQGNNLGDDITYSGTVAAAMEGLISEIPSIAVSMNTKPEWPVDMAARFVR